MINWINKIASDIFSGIVQIWISPHGFYVFAALFITIVIMGILLCFAIVQEKNFIKHIENSLDGEGNQNSL